MKNYVLISDAQQLFKESLSGIINEEINKNYICKYCCNYKNLIQSIKVIDGEIKLVVLGTNLSDINDINKSISKLNSWTKAPILIVTTINDKLFAEKAIASGATSYILKTISHHRCRKVIADTLLGLKRIKLDKLAANNALSILNNLTKRQYEILTEISHGLLNKQIAHKLNISESTVKIHVSSILMRLSVNNRTEAVYKFFQATQLRGGDFE